MRTIVIIAALALTLGCGGVPKWGDSCSEEGKFICDDGKGGESTRSATGSSGGTTEALECYQGRYRTVPCPGAGGCRLGELDTTCDVGDQVRTSPKDGDNCWVRFAGMKLCEVGQANSMVVCTNGTWTRQTCTNCTKHVDGPVCQ